MLGLVLLKSEHPIVKQDFQGREDAGKKGGDAESCKPDREEAGWGIQNKGNQIT